MSQGLRVDLESFQRARMGNARGSKNEYLLDLEYSIELSRWILKPMGAWPKSQESSAIDTFFVKSIKFLVILMILFILVPCIAFVVLEVTDTYERIRFAGPLIFFFMAMLKYLSIIGHEEDIVFCIGKMKKDWECQRNGKGERKIMLEYAKFGRRLIVICALFMYGGAVFFYLAVPVEAGLVFDGTTNLTYLPLVYPVPSIVIDTRKTPTNEIFFVAQFASGFLVHNITTGACSLAAILAMHACGQVEVLKMQLGHLVEGRKDSQDDVSQRLRRIIEQHVRILEFVSRTRTLLREISFVEFVGCTLDICLIEYYFIREWNEKETIRVITFLILWVSLTFNIFIFCYIGELLSEQCEKIGESSYMIEWHRLPRMTGLGLALSIAMSNSTTKLSAGNFVELSLFSFGHVIKSSFAYLHMLRTVTM